MIADHFAWQGMQESRARLLQRLQTGAQEAGLSKSPLGHRGNPWWVFRIPLPLNPHALQPMICRCLGMQSNENLGVHRIAA